MTDNITTLLEYGLYFLNHISHLHVCVMTALIQFSIPVTSEEDCEMSHNTETG